MSVHSFSERLSELEIGEVPAGTPLFVLLGSFGVPTARVTIVKTFKWFYDKKLPYLFFYIISKVCIISTYHAKLWREVRLFGLRILDTIARHYSIKKWPTSKEVVGSREAVKQDP